MHYIVKECCKCKELMPIWEKICYCGGSIKKVEVLLEQKKKSESYISRKWLFNIKSENK